MPDRDLLKDLMERRPVLYWADFLASAIGGWALFLLAAESGSLAPAVGAALLLYRALFFVHELSHMPQGTLPGFRLAWDALVGIPFLIPASLYLGTHRDHHRESTYATGQDPEYSYLIRDGRIAMVLFMVQALLTPAAIALRFLVLAP
ncbi:MAG TPA: fatty acid desaturase, partial [Bdellovibrionota bacterium]|nr:fatty acid desaturase [Bdellovibrionota bacterium]